MIFNLYNSGLVIISAQKNQTNYTHNSFHCIESGSAESFIPTIAYQWGWVTLNAIILNHLT